MARLAPSSSPSALTPMSPSTTFDDLPDDCLSLIIGEVAKLEGEGWRDPKNVKNLSLVSKHLRQLSLPVLFNGFDKLNLNKHSRPTPETFGALSKAPIAVSAIQAFKVQLYEDPKSPYDEVFYSNFVGAIAAMTNLSELNLNFDLNESISSALCEAFQSSKAEFPSIQTLELLRVPNAAFILKACPSLKTLVTSHLKIGWKKTLGPIPSMKSLTRFEMDPDESWTVKRLEAILPYIKNVPELCIKGDLYRFKVSTLASVFADLPHLTALAITSEQWVNKARLSKFYFDDRLLDAIDEEVYHHPLNEAPTDVARKFFTLCPALTTFRVYMHHFEPHRYDCTRGEDGEIKKIQAVKNDEEDGYGFPMVFHMFND